MKHIHAIILAESHIIREGLISIFSHLDFVKRVTYVSNFDELNDVLNNSACNFIVINPSFIQSNFQAFQSIKNRYDCVKWLGIIYTVHPDQDLHKLDGTINIFDSNESISKKMLKWSELEDSDNSQQKDSLSEREEDVLKLLVKGKSNKEVASELSISTNTVITHRKNISQKTGIKSLSGLTIYAVTQNLVSLDDYDL